jgi:iron complex transport system substrate-binding protein
MSPDDALISCRSLRAEFLASALYLVLMSLVLAGCAGSTAPAPSAPPTATAFPVTVTHKLGSAVIPQQPKRIVALSPQDADITVALGVLPVAMTKYLYGTENGRTRWLSSKPGVATVELLDEDHAGTVSLEKVAA